VVINDFDLVTVAGIPNETNAPLLIDADAELPGTIRFQCLQPVTRGHPQLTQFGGRVHLQELPPGGPLDRLRKPPGQDRPKDFFGFPASPAKDHFAPIITRHVTVRNPEIPFFACIRLPSWFNFPVMALPYQISTLLYGFNPRDEVLLLQRRREPNRGLWSPGGGKLQTDTGESPYACACREAAEEMGLALTPQDLHLTGLVSEHGYESQAHWLMFLFEIKPRLTALPPEHAEGVFHFFPHPALAGLRLPRTDREKIWPLFWEHRGGFFAAHCHCHPDGRTDWTVEEVLPPVS
jgi:8-oxo-dGTP diphosphatase